jgi:hypothetical protein
MRQTARQHHRHNNAIIDNDDNDVESGGWSKWSKVRHGINGIDSEGSGGSGGNDASAPGAGGSGGGNGGGGGGSSGGGSGGSGGPPYGYITLAGWRDTGRVKDTAMRQKQPVHEGLCTDCGGGNGGQRNYTCTHTTRLHVCHPLGESHCSLCMHYTDNSSMDLHNPCRNDSLTETRSFYRLTNKQT